MRPKGSLPTAAYLLLLASWAVPAYAATAQASFAVQIQLNNPASAYCVSRMLSQSANAVVTVVCGSNQFVSIELQPGNSFLDTDGGAYRLEPGASILPDDSLWYMGPGTITTMRVSRAEGQRGATELLVSF